MRTARAISGAVYRLLEGIKPARSHRITRGVLSCGLSLCLVLSFVQAPFQHIHASDPHHRHAKGFVHAHWSHGSRPGVTATAKYDSDALPLAWFAGDGRAAVQFAFTLVEAPTVPVPVMPAGEAIEQPSPRGHDPPFVLTSIPRAPPV